ncbi:hypothetical protein B9Z55_018951 [Caenorhabditis nigoni]|uniref:BTB domain-containing protein n=1 Tax=Caenorhabditis nigoni TaxID=1611254 RepID=A0A2G5TGH5_9PELO|nr:hypothetical protein B9Z55_018951 [Caenorhabditis nigoni]
MVNTRKGKKKPENEQKTDSLSDIDGIFEKLKVLVAAETEKIQNSQKQKFDKVQEKLQEIEKSMAKISKLDDDEKKVLLNVRFVKEKLAKSKCVLKSVATLKEGDYICSQEEEHFNLKWYMGIRRHESHITLFVFCDPIVPVKDEWSIDTKLEFRMMGRNNKSVIKTMECCFKKRNGFGSRGFMGFDDIEEEYMIDDKLNAEVKIEVLKMTAFEEKRIRKFDELQKDVSDVILLMQDTKFYVSKMYLAAQSSYFKTLFFGNFSESGKSEILLTGIEPEDFQLYLEVLYGENAIDDFTVKRILSVADFYYTPVVLRRSSNLSTEPSSEMVNTRKGNKKPESEPEADSQSENDEIFDKLKVLVAAETEKIKNSQTQRFDKIQEKLQEMEKSMAKISKLDDDEKKFLLNKQINKKRKSAKKFVMEYSDDCLEDEESGYCELDDDLEHFNLKWYIGIERDEGHLEFRVFCIPIASVAEKWSLETNLELKIIGKDNKIVIRTEKGIFKHDEEYGIAGFLQYENVKEYLIDGSLLFELEVEILKMTGFKEKLRLFDESQKEVSDVILVVQDVKFYVSKMYLAAQSTFFKNLFFGHPSESNKSEIPLSGIEPEDFQNYLEVLYGEFAIDDFAVEGILHVADMYSTPMVLERCENFLMSCGFNLKEKLQISKQYRFEKLMNQCLSNVDKFRDVVDDLPDDLSDLDPSFALIILQKCVSSEKTKRRFRFL